MKRQRFFYFDDLLFQLGHIQKTAVSLVLCAPLGWWRLCEICMVGHEFVIIPSVGTTHATTPIRYYSWPRFFFRSLFPLHLGIWGSRGVELRRARDRVWPAMKQGFLFERRDEE